MFSFTAVKGQIYSGQIPATTNSKPQTTNTFWEIDVLYGYSLPFGHYGSDQPKKGARYMYCFIKPSTSFGLSVLHKTKCGLNLVTEIHRVTYNMDREAYFNFLGDLYYPNQNAHNSFAESELPTFTMTSVLTGFFLRFGKSRFQVQTQFLIGAISIQNTPLKVVSTDNMGVAQHYHTFHDYRRYEFLVSPGLSFRFRLFSHLNLLLAENLHMTRYDPGYKLYYDRDAKWDRILYLTSNTMLGLGYRF